MSDNLNKDNRIQIRLPYVMIKEVDRLVSDCPIYGNRQQFVEQAIREKIINARVEEAALRNARQRHPQ